MLEQTQQRYVSPYNLALVFAGLGKTEEALQWLQKAVEVRDVHMIFLRDHKWDGTKAEPEFQKLLVRVGLAGLA